MKPTSLSGVKSHQVNPNGECSVSKDGKTSEQEMSKTFLMGQTGVRDGEWQQPVLSPEQVWNAWHLVQGLNQWEHSIPTRELMVVAMRKGSQPDFGLLGHWVWRMRARIANKCWRGVFLTQERVCIESSSQLQHLSFQSCNHGDLGPWIALVPSLDKIPSV